MFETTNLWHLGLLFWYSPIFFITWIIVRSSVVACATRFLFFPLGGGITPFLLLILGGLSFGRFSASSGRQWWLWRTPCTVWTWLLRHFTIEPRRLLVTDLDLLPGRGQFYAGCEYLYIDNQGGCWSSNLRLLNIQYQGNVYAREGPCRYNGRENGERGCVM